MQEENPLVSIIIITYNSSKYVLETLESSKGQTYQNIELIVSDDCSTDYTVEICRVWIEENKERFVRTEMITTEKNTGIPANCNRGLYAAKGKWIKFIAGDDALLENCILDNINYTFMNSSAKIIFSKLQIIKSESSVKEFNYNTFFYNLAVEDQTHQLLFSNTINAVTSFINRNLILNLGGFDEKYSLLEDYPLWLKSTSFGYKLYGFDTITCMYRVHDTNVSIRKQSILNIELENNILKFYKTSVTPLALKRMDLIPIFYHLFHRITIFIIILCKNKSYKLNRFLIDVDYKIKILLQNQNKMSSIKHLL
jgi:alpha-1,3-rhamnosyltransferase